MVLWLLPPNNHATTKVPRFTPVGVPVMATRWPFFFNVSTVASVWQAATTASTLALPQSQFSHPLVLRQARVPVDSVEAVSCSTFVSREACCRLSADVDVVVVSTLAFGEDLPPSRPPWLRVSVRRWIQSAERISDPEKGWPARRVSMIDFRG